MWRITRLTAPAVFLLAALLTWDAPAPAAAPPPSEAWLDRLVAQLGAEKFEIREAAGRALEAAGSAAVPALRRGLESDDLDVRKRGLQLLRKAEKQTAAFFTALGVDVYWRGGKADVVSYKSRDRSKLRDEHLRELVGLPWLKRVFLPGAPVGDTGMAYVGRLTELDYLDLTGTRVTDDGLAWLAGLTKLETLRLDRTALSGQGLIHLHAMKRLANLGLNGTKLTDGGLAAGVSGLKTVKSLRSLGLMETQLTDRGLASLKEVTQVTGLGLSGTRVTDRGVVHLRALPDLLDVDLGRTTITDKGCAELARIETLVRIQLNGTKVTAAGLRAFKTLPRLRQLTFHDIEIGEKEEEGLLAVMPQRVFLSGDSLQGAGRSAEKR